MEHCGSKEFIEAMKHISARAEIPILVSSLFALCPSGQPLGKAMKGEASERVRSMGAA